MKKIVTAVCITLSAAVFISGCGSKDSKKAGKMRTEMTAAEYAVDMGVGINLGNTMEAYWEDKSDKTSGCSLIGENSPQDYETCWGAEVTTQEMIDGIKTAGFSTVRIPVYWGNMMEDDGTYTINQDYLERVGEIVDYCLNDGLYAVVNIQHYDEFLIKNHEKDEVLEATEHLWTQIADYYKNYSDYLIFEGFNENLGSQPEDSSYSDDELYDYVNEMNQTFVTAVRETGGNNENRLLIASGYWTNIDLTTSDSFVMPEDSAENKLMVSVHYIDNAKYWANQVGNQAWLDYSTEQCELLKSAFTDKGIPVFVGECTSIYESSHLAKNAEYTESSDCLREILNMAVDYGFVPVLWDVSNNFYSRTDCEIISGNDQNVINEISGKIKS